MEFTAMEISLIEKATFEASFDVTRQELLDLQLTLAGTCGGGGDVFVG
jgi:hypothetical protein